MFLRDVWWFQFLSDSITILTRSQSRQLRIWADGERGKEFLFF